MHSHINGIVTDDHFTSSCLGSGPINRTINSSSNEIQSNKTHMDNYIDGIIENNQTEDKTETKPNNDKKDEVAVDKSADALKLAKANYELNGFEFYELKLRKYSTAGEKIKTQTSTHRSFFISL